LAWQVRLGMARYGVERFDKAGKAWHGWVWTGRVRQARLVKDWYGMERFSRLGTAGRGSVRRGQARQARRGTARSVWAGIGTVWFDMAG
jgi:hypothetical protein